MFGPLSPERVEDSSVARGGGSSMGKTSRGWLQTFPSIGSGRLPARTTARARRDSYTSTLRMSPNFKRRGCFELRTTLLLPLAIHSVHDVALAALFPMERERLRLACVVHD